MALAADNCVFVVQARRRRNTTLVIFMVDFFKQLLGILRFLELGFCFDYVGMNYVKPSNLYFSGVVKRFRIKLLKLEVKDLTIWTKISPYEDKERTKDAPFTISPCILPKITISSRLTPKVAIISDLALKLPSSRHTILEKYFSRPKDERSLLVSMRVLLVTRHNVFPLVCKLLRVLMMFFVSLLRWANFSLPSV